MDCAKPCRIPPKIDFERKNSVSIARVQQGMSRKPLILAAFIVVLHLFEAATLGTTATGSLLANLLEIFASGFAVVMAFAAYPRAPVLTRPSSFLVAPPTPICHIANLALLYSASL